MIRTVEQRELTKALKLDRYLASKDFERKSETFFAILDTYRPLVTRLNGELDGGAMAELLACVLERDATFLAAIRKPRRSSTQLETRDGWEAVTRTVAALVVERYLRRDEIPEHNDDLMLTTDELAERLGTVFNEMSAHAEELAGHGDTVRNAERLTLPPNVAPKVRDGAAEQLLAALAAELPLLSSPDGEGKIPVDERNREVAKRALVRLRIKQLREVADERGLELGGTAEQLAERLADSADDDASAVAEMVLEKEGEGSEHGLVTTVFRTKSDVSAGAAATDLRRLRGNYARIGVARWFICNDVTESATSVSTKGVLRYYRVNPKLDYDTYDLSSDPAEAAVVIAARAGKPWLEVSTRMQADSTSLAQLAARVMGIGLAPAVAQRLASVPESLQAWPANSIRMLSLLADELNSGDFELVNVAVVQFDTPHSVSVDKDAPAVKNVRVGGQHLMSHRQTCELLVAGRTLSQVRGSVRVNLGATHKPIVPFRVSLSESDATVLTAFTKTTSEADTTVIHRRLLDAVEFALLRQDVAPEALRQVPAIVQRAASDATGSADIITAG